MNLKHKNFQASNVKVLDSAQGIIECINNPESIVVAGQWGYSATLPDRAWSAILGRAALEVAPLIALQISEGLVVKKALEEQEHYLNSAGQSPLTIAAAGWEQTFKTAAKRYKLRTV